MNLMNLEMMNGTERVAEALQTRGLFVKGKGDLIVLTTENTKEDIEGVRHLLEQVGIPTFWSDYQTFQVLVNRIPVALMKRIMNTRGREFPVSMEGYHYKWRSFVQRRYGIKVNALEIDANVAMFVKTLNLSGITALAGCNGHHRYQPNVQLSGEFQGAWFEVIQEKYLGDCSLHHQWKVHYGNQSGSCIVADKKEHERWNMNHVYQDTMQMASLLQQHAEEIRVLKQNTFKRKGEMKDHAERLAGEKSYKELVNWMKGEIAKATI
ncbi:hypothetical protein [Halalkalibacter alkaliphilus]|uniref:Uncharacterized protein n=1 Tax=Halalkalibacter alkaliphilus TaxID=2917993 RepID=A0A9X2CV13_9BACI|nr:hypothetical protein [Halalkalibacter alkaliphilus]MCL7748741.1 hypothetical protein [Halalkalibacter alkaliphilus]